MGYHFNILGWLAGWVLCQLFVLPRLLAGRAAQLAGKSQAPCKYGSKSSKTLCWPAGDLMIISSVQVCSIRSCGTWGAGGRFLKGSFREQHRQSGLGTAPGTEGSVALLLPVAVAAHARGAPVVASTWQKAASSASPLSLQQTGANAATKTDLQRERAAMQVSRFLSGSDGSSECTCGIRTAGLVTELCEEPSRLRGIRESEKKIDCCNHTLLSSR